MPGCQGVGTSTRRLRQGPQISATGVSTLSRTKEDGTTAQQTTAEDAGTGRMEAFSSPEVDADPKDSRRTRGSFPSIVRIVEFPPKLGCNRGKRER